MTEPRSTDPTTEAPEREVGFQSSYRAPFRETFAHLVGPRTSDFGTQPGYVALYIGGHDGIRVSLSHDQAGQVADLIRFTLDFGEDEGPKVRLRDVAAVLSEAERSALADAEDEAWLGSKTDPAVTA